MTETVLDPVARQAHTARWSAALRVLAVLTVAGAVVGVLWTLLAPPVHGVVALSKSGERAHAYLGSESDHFFVAAAMLLGMLTVLAVVAAVAVWQWRAHRGPVLVAALTLGSALGALAAAGSGTVAMRARYGVLDVDAVAVTPENRFHYFTEAPSAFFGHTPLQMAIGVLVPAAVAAAVYALFAVATARDDLGADPPQPVPGLPPPLTDPLTGPLTDPLTTVDGQPPGR